MASKGTLSEEQRNFYQENGFVILPDVVDDDTCEKMKSLAETLAEEDYSAIQNIHRKIVFFLEIMKNPILVSIVKALQKHKIVGIQDQYLFKRAGTPYARQAWNPHQDIANLEARKGTYLTLHIFLDPQDQENGGIYYYSGSHREEVLPYEYGKSWKEDFDEYGISHPGFLIKQIPSQYKKVDVVAPKGAIGLQHGSIIHGSYPNLSSHRSRAQYSIGYLNEGEKFNRGYTSIKIPVVLEKEELGR